MKVSGGPRSIGRLTPGSRDAAPETVRPFGPGRGLRPRLRRIPPVLTAAAVAESPILPIDLPGLPVPGVPGIVLRQAPVATWLPGLRGIRPLSDVRSGEPLREPV
jgi:hypothetical protein